MLYEVITVQMGPMVSAEQRAKVEAQPDQDPGHGPLREPPEHDPQREDVV